MDTSVIGSYAATLRDRLDVAQRVVLGPFIYPAAHPVSMPLPMELARAYLAVNTSLDFALTSLEAPLPISAKLARLYTLPLVTDAASAHTAYEALNAYLHAPVSEHAGLKSPWPNDSTRDPLDALLWAEFAVVVLELAANMAADPDRTLQARSALAIVGECSAKAATASGISFEHIYELLRDMRSLTVGLDGPSIV